MTLCALNDVKQYTGVTSNATDAVLTALIANASDFIERYCNRVFEQTTFTDVRNGNGADAIFLRHVPILSVQSVSVDGTTVPPAPDARSYGWVNDEHKVYIRGYARVNPESPDVYVGAPRGFSRGIQNIQIAYTAGHATIPLSVNQACVELVAYKFAKRQRIDKKNEVLAQQTVGFDLSDMPASVKTELAQWIVPMVAP